jgi:hypothetical protein
LFTIVVIFLVIGLISTLSSQNNSTVNRQSQSSNQGVAT